MNRHLHQIALLAWIVAMAIAPAAHAQKRPYIGYVYPAGGQQATTFQIKLGGQDLDAVNSVIVSGPGVTARIVDYLWRLQTPEVQLLNAQLKELQRKPAAAPAMAAENPMMMTEMAAEKIPAAPATDVQPLIAKIQQRVHGTVQQPASAALSNIVIAEVSIAANATPGVRELRLVTLRGVSNPLPFFVGQLPESVRQPMLSASLQVLGKESTALRKRPPEEAEKLITLPCTANGQIASGEVNRYRFHARTGQRLVISTQARQLIPYIADAVPGWFQPVLALYDASGREVAYADDYRFQPDPVIFYQVPKDGEYVFAISDALYRGREDFIYRITAGELPFVTSIFPMGGQVANPQPPSMTGWGLAGAKLSTPTTNSGAGIIALTANQAGHVSNSVPFALDTLPEQRDQEPNDSIAIAQRVALPIIINGNIDRPGDWDVFQFTGKAHDQLVIEVLARRLNSPLDSIIKLTNSTGKLIAFNDDCEDLTAGTNPHHADSSLLTQLPADGTYFVHIGDTAGHAGKEFGYRLRISAPRPDFALRVVPSSVSLPLNSSAVLSVYAMRKDGFTGPITVTLQNPPPGFSAKPVVIPPNQTLAKFSFKGGSTPAPVQLTVVGSAMLDNSTPGSTATVHTAVPAEDRMQAFLWRHLVPASDLQVLVFDPKYQPPPKRVAPTRPPPPPTPPPFIGPLQTTPPMPKFTKSQISGRLQQLKRLYEEGLLTDSFYDAKLTECEAAQ